MRTGSSWHCRCLGLELQLLLSQHATWPYTLVMDGSLTSSVDLPMAGGPRGAFMRSHTVIASTVPGGRSSSFSSHPTVLASQGAWLTGESQFSRFLTSLCPTESHTEPHSPLALCHGIHNMFMNISTGMFMS